MLSGSAENALLKTLEEPPPHIIFVLATTEPQKVSATIISRCQRFDLRAGAGGARAGGGGGFGVGLGQGRAIAGRGRPARGGARRWGQPPRRDQRTRADRNLLRPIADTGAGPRNAGRQRGRPQRSAS